MTFSTRLLPLKSLLQPAKRIFGALVVASVSSVCWVTQAAAVDTYYVERFIPNLHYKVLPKPIKFANNEAQHQVIEFFSYGCPHCEHLEAPLNAWLKAKPDSVAFERIPANWNPTFKRLGQLYYTLEQMGVAAKFDGTVFDYIHTQGKKLRSKSDIFAFAEDVLKLDIDEFKAVWGSDGVESAMNQAMQQLQASDVKGVPAVMVNGKYQISVAQAGSPEAVFDVVNFLIKK